jgi:hypothetical protein
LEKTYELTLRDIYGGDGFVRYVEVEEQILDRTKKTKRTRSDIGVSVENGMSEVSSRKTRREVSNLCCD